MRVLSTRILIALLVLSQTWTGALRGLEFCIPIGLCEGCGVWMLAHHSHEKGHDHGHDHGHVAASAHAAHEDSHRHAHGAPHGVNGAPHGVNGAPHGDSGCVCHIHVATPDDDTHRGSAPGAGLVLVTVDAGLFEPWLLASRLTAPMRRVAEPPDPDAPPRFERRAIEATVLQV
jgi:ABC-type nickel/cobalt efflux system permease component RcnA